MVRSARIEFERPLSASYDRVLPVNLLIEPDYRDPISGFPGFKSLLCEIKKAGQ